MPIILRGARQVGKSTLVQLFGKKNFDSVATVNFEQSPDLKACFSTLFPKEILAQLEVRLNMRIYPGKTLLFLDEIQEVPRALTALRYFKEQMPALHVISAGSLLEFSLHDEDFSFPVGRVQFLYLYPLSFREMLEARGEEILIERLQEATLDRPLPESLHHHALGLVRDYFVVGGMPAAVASFVKEPSFFQSQRLLSGILQTYQNDFGKYASQAQHRVLESFFVGAPPIVTKHFQYKKIDPNLRSRELKVALQQLLWAGLLYQVHAAKGHGVPLAASANERKFKLLFLDIADIPHHSSE